MLQTANRGAGAKAELLQTEIRNAGYVLDPPTVHHKFISGMHGQKLDFDNIPGDSTLFGLWVDTVATTIHELYKHEDFSRLALLSVANGTNRIVRPVAETLGVGVEPLLTQKDPNDDEKIILTPEARFHIQNCSPELVVVVEDAATTGSTAAQAVSAARGVGSKRQEVINTWQRRDTLEKLVGIKAVYHSIITEPLPTYPQEDCESIGFCAQGWELIPR